MIHLWVQSKLYSKALKEEIENKLFLYKLCYTNLKTSSKLMKLGIMQPYFLPYLGYYSLIKATDQWIVFDTPQYARHSWINRNRIIHPCKDDWIYITVPVKKHKQKESINNIQIQNINNWKERIIDQLAYYKKRAPYYNEVRDFLIEAFRFQYQNLSELNIYLLKLTCEYIGINFNYQVYFDIKLDISPPTEADEWSVLICKALGARQYINPEGGVKFFRKEIFIENEIDLKFLKFGLPTYNQDRDVFLPALSVLDAMMFNTPYQINQMLDDYQLISE